MEPSGNDEVGPLDIKVTATDEGGLTVSDSFALVVYNTNDAPILANGIVNQSTSEDAPFNFTLPATIFSDVDAGGSLTLNATLSDGGVLPGWLSFDALTGTFSGTPDNSAVGTLSIKVTAIDVAGASVSDQFDVAVLNTNDAPVVSNLLSDVSTAEDSLFTFIR